MAVKSKRKVKPKPKAKPRGRSIADTDKRPRKQPKSTMDVKRVTKKEWNEIVEGHEYMFPDVKEMYAAPILGCNNKGRTKHFDNPGLLWSAALEYFKWVNDNPWYKAEWKGDALRRIPIGRPYTLAAFCLRIGTTDDYFRVFKSQLKSTDPMYDDFNMVIRKIEHVCRSQRFEGASVGVFNAHFMSYDLGMRKDEGNGGASAPGITIVVNTLEDNELLESVKRRIAEIDEQAMEHNS